MIALCGQCRWALGATKRWKEEARARVGEGIVLIIPPEHPCDGCGHHPLSRKYRHTVFIATRAELDAAKREVAA